MGGGPAALLPRTPAETSLEFAFEASFPQSEPCGMIFEQTKLRGVMEVRLNRIADERGFFARSWCRDEFEKAGLNAQLAQCSISFNPRKGTLRGMHYQVPPHAEAKLVRCTMGAVYDVILDLRAESQTYKKSVGVMLTAENRNMVYIPEGCAHGFLTLEDNCEIFYQISEFYSPEAARGVRWNDPAFGIAWPAAPQLISDRDRNYPDFA
jgi:dTDP-4-dehydrorhamnose 3,5-epimerase